MEICCCMQPNCTGFTPSHESPSVQTDNLFLLLFSRSRPDRIYCSGSSIGSSDIWTLSFPRDLYRVGLRFSQVNIGQLRIEKPKCLWKGEGLCVVFGFGLAYLLAPCSTWPFFTASPRDSPRRSYQAKSDCWSETTSIWQARIGSSSPGRHVSLAHPTLETGHDKGIVTVGMWSHGLYIWYGAQVKRTRDAVLTKHSQQEQRLKLSTYAPFPKAEITFLV